MRFVAPLLVLLIGCPAASDAPLRASPAPPQVAWSDVDAPEALAELAAKAAAGDEALLLDVRADWCAPCIELERKTFADRDVRTIVAASFVAARLDVTVPTPDEELLQGLVGGSSMPWLAFWPLSEDEVAVFAQGKVPPPAKTISTFVSAQELLPTLRALAAQ